MQARQKGWPLRPTLVTGVMVLILLAAGTTGISAYQSSRRGLSSLWRGLAGQVAQRITEKALRFLEPAVPYLEMTSSLANQGKLNPDHHKVLLAYFKEALDANPTFTWASYGEEETGIYVAAYRSAHDPTRIYGTIRNQHPEEHTTVWNDFIWSQKDNAFEPSRDARRELYDPRTRSWYKSAAKADAGVWGEPFLFTSHKQPGFFYSKRFMRDGKLHGVFAVQWEVKYLSDFLKTIELGEHGRVYVVSKKDGLVVGHPEFQVLTGQGDSLRILRADEHPDALLREAWQTWNKRGNAERFGFGEYLGLAEPFPPSSGIDWVVMGVAPVDDFFGEAKRQAMVAFIISGVCLLAAIVFGALLANRIAAALREMSDEMERIGRFDIGHNELKAQHSLVREVNVMGAAAERMKSSLRSFAKYVPTRLVQMLMQSGQEAVLGGDKRELTILFCDIAGFTTLSEQMAPEQLVDALAEYFKGASEAIQETGGTVDKFIGDAVMAFWGAPAAVEDAPIKACRAAIAIQKKVHAMSERWQAQGRPRFEVRIGINTGACLVGNIGSQQRMNYTVMGDAVNTASRLEGLNKAYGTNIMLGETTAAAVGDRMLLRPLDFVAVKGKAHAILVHELVGEPQDGAAAKAAALHKQGLDLYRQRHFSAAAARFEEVTVVLGGKDDASRVMAERARHYAAEPPPERWDGAHVMKEK